MIALEMVALHVGWLIGSTLGGGIINFVSPSSAFFMVSFVMFFKNFGSAPAAKHVFDSQNRTTRKVFTSIPGKRLFMFDLIKQNGRAC
ncbi:MAG: hypothetical protein CM1200mP39_18120 [Dehalococcoidia bacterium]|nr:MAG: hypothetical protein CM1200mP39_18120 [Dehalococcoidia bacterium]